MKRILRLALLTALLLLLLCGTVFASPSFWAEADVQAAIGRGLVPESLQFDYQAPITRAEFCELIAQVVPETNGPAFPDCDTQAVRTCTACGILYGYPDGTFHPDELLTREQAAAILRRLAAFEGRDTDTARLLHIFDDSHLISAYATRDVEWAYQNGILFGVGGDRFAPDESYTREQSILTLLRLEDGSTAPAQPDALRIFHTAAEEITVTETRSGKLEQRFYTFSGGAEAVMGHLVGASGLRTVFTARVSGLPTIRIPDGQGWRTARLTAGVYPTTCCYVDAEDGAYWFYPPQQYRLQPRSTLEALPGRDGWLDVQKDGDGFLLRLMVSAVGSGTCADYTALFSPTPLFDWDSRSLDYMAPFRLNGDGRWCWDGYYYLAPDNYDPAGKNFYHRCTACYFGGSMANAIGYYYGCELMSLVVADTMVQQQNEAGYLPTVSGSGWLSGSYGIGPGFYDTRFNSDFMEMLNRISVSLRTEAFFPTMNAYMDFYLRHAEAHHSTTASGGWLVEDYSLPGTASKTHTSLNHQLSEMSVLYKLSGLLDRSELSELADRMLLALEDTCERWIRPDSNLHYSCGADGVFGGNDYPELTYNDLYKTQQLLEQRTGARNDKLQRLMDAKLSWIKANNVTGYLK